VFQNKQAGSIGSGIFAVSFFVIAAAIPFLTIFI
jgi:hypothetical protein